MFDTMSAHMRASWCAPVPGSVIEGGYEASYGWRKTLPKLGEAVGEEEERDLGVALGNFALVVIEPVEVDHVELGVLPYRRTTFKIDGEGRWFEEAVVP
jgi:pyridoxamine 5'-phosphate oxidase